MTKTGMAGAVAFAVIGVSTSGLAQRGPYLRVDAGGNAAFGISVTGSDNDWGTRCDRIINPEGIEVGDECELAPGGSEWSQDFGGGAGILSGIAVGYRWDRFHFEVEAFHQGTVFDEIEEINILDEATLEKRQQEIERTFGVVNDVSSTNLFANLYYSFAPESARVRPFAGIGGGIARASLYYATYWKRNDKPEFISTFEDPLLRAKLAGTTTVGKARHADQVLGVQAVAGIEWRLADQVWLGVRARGLTYGKFTGDPIEWDELRSHQSDVGRGETILYTVETEGARYLGLSLGLRYEF